MTAWFISFYRFESAGVFSGCRSAASRSLAADAGGRALGSDCSSIGLHVPRLRPAIFID